MKKCAVIVAVIGCMMAELLTLNASAEEISVQTVENVPVYDSEHLFDPMEEPTEDETTVFIENPEACSGDYDSLHWEYADNVLTVSGEGKIVNDFSHHLPWYPLSKAIHTLIIEEGITSIGTYTFQDCSNLTSISIPNTVKRIGEDAFYENTSLKSIVIPDSVEQIEGQAFAFCEQLSDVTLPKNLKSVGKYTFYMTPWYNSLQPDENGLTIYENILFDVNEKSEKIVIPDNVRIIGSYAFDFCYDLTSIVIPDSVKYIGNYAFCENYSLESITIPEGVESIGYYAFIECKKLKSITFPESMEYVNTQRYTDELQTLTFLNAECVIGKQISPQTVTVYGYPDYTAEKMAQENGWEFVALEGIPKIKGDMDGDGKFSLVDLIQVNQMLQSRQAPPESCDLNRDNVVNVIDLALMKQKLLTQ